MKWLLPALLASVAAPAFGAEVTAVASFSILGDMVAQIGGDRIALRTDSDVQGGGFAG